MVLHARKVFASLWHTCYCGFSCWWFCSLSGGGSKGCCCSEKGPEHRMRFRSDQRAPLKQGQFRTLPSINQHHLDTPTDRNDTDIFHATLRGLTAAQTAEPAGEETEQASIGDLAPHAPESSPQREPPIFRRRMVVIVVALFVLLTIASGMVGARLGGVGADQATSIAIATPTPLPATGPQSGIVSVETPTPSATATPTPKPKPPTPTPAPQPSPPPYSTDGPYSNSTPPPG